MIETITSNTIEISSRGSSPRLTFLMSRLLTHLHDFARETRLNTEEWMAGIEFLTEVGKMCSDSRQVLDQSNSIRETFFERK